MHYSAKISKRGSDRSGVSGTYKDPRANKNINAIFFFVFKLKSFNSQIGSNIITKSSKMLNPAAAYTNACELVHFPFIE